jgi:hypothetical protein
MKNSKGTVTKGPYTCKSVAIATFTDIITVCRYRCFTASSLTRRRKLPDRPTRYETWTLNHFHACGNNGTIYGCQTRLCLTRQIVKQKRYHTLRRWRSVGQHGTVTLDCPNAYYVSSTFSTFVMCAHGFTMVLLILMSHTRL